MNKLSLERKAQVMKTLCEGNSIRATCRITNTAKGTVMRLLRDVGKACAEYQDKHVRNLPCQRVECDEIWSFCYAKEKNVPEPKRGQFGYGDVWTFAAIDSDTKLVLTWLVALREPQFALRFFKDIRQRIANHVQLTTDGHRMYSYAGREAFGPDTDYAMLVKYYSTIYDQNGHYSPPKCTHTERKLINGSPDMSKVSTSYVERQNLTMRMSMRRFTRLTNAFAKKIENLEYAIALHFMYYNFARAHKTLTNPYPKTTAMAAGISKHVWTMEEIIGLIGK
jgi:IS1 family transposase